MTPKFEKGEGQPRILQVGCNYHTTWQSDKRMRFVLKEVKDGKARLATRTTRKNFWTNISDLIFIETDYNKSKAKELSQNTTSNDSI